jgi:D-alanyl-D-alanine carboxypeptidase
MTTKSTYPPTRIVIFVFCAVFSSVSTAQVTAEEPDKQINKLLITHYNKYHEVEYFSGAPLSVYLPENDFPDKSIRNCFVGNVARDAHSEPIGAETLFQIGSISKSFTGALILQLEKEGKITLADTAGTWLPQYPKWAAVDIKSMLNMTTRLWLGCHPGLQSRRWTILVL